MEGSRRIYGFDYIKIIAASLIVFHHYQQVFQCHFDGLLNFYGGRIVFGYLVELFFTISGFLTVYSDYRKSTACGSSRIETNKKQQRYILAENENTLATHSYQVLQSKCSRGGGTILNSIFRRFARLYPMSFISILICLVFKTLYILFTSDGQLLELWNVKTLVANFCLIFAGYPFFEMTGINNPLWYICVLIQCYLIYYILSGILKKLSADDNEWMLPVASISVVVVATVAFYFKILNESSFRGLVSFFLGVFVYSSNKFLEKKRIINCRNQKFFGIFVVFLSIILSVFLLRRINQRWVFQFCLYPLFILGIYNIDLPKIAGISEMSDVSFEVYVMHYPLMVFVQLLAGIFKIKLNHSYATMLLFLTACWIVGFLMWKYIDLPIRKKVKCIEVKYA